MPAPGAGRLLPLLLIHDDYERSLRAAPTRVAVAAALKRLQQLSFAGGMFSSASHATPQTRAGFIFAIVLTCTSRYAPYRSTFCRKSLTEGFAVVRGGGFFFPVLFSLMCRSFSALLPWCRLQVASAIFVLDLKGKILISRDYRGDVPKSAVDKCVLTGCLAAFGGTFPLLFATGDVMHSRARVLSPVPACVPCRHTAIDAQYLYCYLACCTRGSHHAHQVLTAVARV